jgi:hypothetical protein
MNCFTSGHRTSVYDTNKTLVRRTERRCMEITVVAVMCHAIGAVVAQSVDSLPDPVCREVVVIKNDMPMQSCIFSQPALADWKERSIYRSDQWWISRIKCVPGDYVPKERI